MYEQYSYCQLYLRLLEASNFLFHNQHKDIHIRQGNQNNQLKCIEFVQGNKDGTYKYITGGSAVPSSLEAFFKQPKSQIFESSITM